MKYESGVWTNLCNLCLAFSDSYVGFNKSCSIYEGFLRLDGNNKIFRWESNSSQKASIMEQDLLNPTFESEKDKHKLKRLVQTPDSYFMDVKCPGCYTIATVFSHAQTVIQCEGCSTILTKPTGGKCKLTVGSAFKVKNWE